MNNDAWPPKGGLYEAICTIRDAAAAEARTFSGQLAELRKQLPPSVGVPRATAQALLETYHLRQEAERIASYLRPVKF